MKKFLAFLMVAVMILGTLTGCGAQTASTPVSETKAETGAVATPEMDKEQYLNLILSAEPSTMDPSKGADSYSNTVLLNVLEPLTRLEEDAEFKNVLRPAGAESWTSDDSGTVWTFKIRAANWSDNKPVTAKDYAYGIQRSLAQDTASPYAYLLTPIKNATKVNSGELPLSDLGVVAIDDQTLQITLEEATPYFLELTYQRVMLPQREDMVTKFGDRYGTELDTMVYNGPFVLSSWSHNSELVLTKNDTYWDKAVVNMQTINLKIIQDENAVYNSLANGSIDATTANKPEWRTKFMADTNLEHLETVNTATYFMLFNTKDSLFKNANIRKAFSLAIDREELANVIFHGVHVPAYGWVSPSIAVGDVEYRSAVPGPLEKLKKENPDPKALLIKGLTELGMDPDPSKLTVKMALGSTDQWFRTYGEYVQQMYMKNLGIQFEVEFMEWPVFSSLVDKGEYQLGYMAWGAEFNDPISLLSLLKSTSSAIGTGWKNEKFDELVDLAAKEMDPVKRMAYYKEAEQILLYDDSVLAPVVYPRSNTFSYKYVKNLGVTPFGTSGYKYTYTVGRP